MSLLTLLADYMMVLLCYLDCYVLFPLKIYHRRAVRYIDRHVYAYITIMVIAMMIGTIISIISKIKLYLNG